MSTEESLPLSGSASEQPNENAEISTPQNDLTADAEPAHTEPQDAAQPLSQQTEDADEQGEDTAEDEKEKLKKVSFTALLDAMESMISEKNPGVLASAFFMHKNELQSRMQEEKNEQKQQWEDSGNDPEEFTYSHKDNDRLNALDRIFREQYEQFLSDKKAEQQENLEKRRAVIEKLKTLNKSSEPGIDYFKEIRLIKEEWRNTGQVNKSDYKIIHEDYLFHLAQFNEMLSLNREYLEQEYAHNLETRKKLIEAATKLLDEPIVQKALTELQYLHKVWKEEAEPVSEEHREETWEAFREISGKIHDRRAEFLEKQQKEQAENFEKKEKLLSQMKELASNECSTHNQWQSAAAAMQKLREEYYETGRVPKEKSDAQWQTFKKLQKEFSQAKNTFYKNQKENFQKNIDAKNALIAKAEENKDNENLEDTAALFRSLQAEWKEIGSVPRSMSDKMWNRFREACNVFFNKYRQAKSEDGDNWQENLRKKEELLQQISGKDSLSEEELSQIKEQWESIGKVPRNRMGIQAEFRKIFREKARSLGMHFGNERNKQTSAADDIRKLKNQISETELKISNMENNLNFFSNPDRSNPLLKETYAQLDAEKVKLAVYREELKSLYSDPL